MKRNGTYDVEITDAVMHKGKDIRDLKPHELRSLVESIRKAMFYDGKNWCEDAPLPDEVEEIGTHLDAYGLKPIEYNSIFRLRAKSRTEACRFAMKRARESGKFVRPYVSTVVSPDGDPYAEIRCRRLK
jgi:hypothetical protein